MYQGSCLCGAVRYQALEFQPHMAHCHCTMCRKFHGAAFATFGEVKAEDFRWVKGEKDLQDYIAENGSTRRFCKHCGSSMSFEPENNINNFVEITLGTLDTPLEDSPDAHIFMNYKAAWIEIEDGLPQHGEGRK